MNCYGCNAEIDESTDKYIVTDTGECYCSNCFDQETIIEYFIGGEYIGNTNNIDIHND